MNITLSTPINIAPTLDQPIIILSEDFATGRQAAQRIRSEWSAINRHTRVNTQVWLFASLNQPSLRQLAVLHAMGAKLVVLCPHGQSPLPLGVKQFLHDWIDGLHDRVCPLVMLSAEDHSTEDAGMIGVILGPDGALRVPVYCRVSEALLAARELARWPWPENAPGVPTLNPQTDANRSPECVLMR